MNELESFKATYFTECSELLADTEENLSALEQGAQDMELVHAVFRAVHSIKGGAGAFGFSELVKFTHSFENLLDLMRDNKIDLSSQVISLCIQGLDIVADLVKAARDGTTLGAEHGALVKSQIEQLSGDGSGAPSIESFDDLDFTPVRVDLLETDDGFGLFDATAAPPEKASQDWIIRFKPHRALFERANDPLWLMMELAGLGQMRLEVQVEPAEPLATFDAMKPLIGWTIYLTSQVSRDEIESVFEFVEGDCDLAITLGSPSSPPPSGWPDVPEMDMMSLLSMVKPESKSNEGASMTAHGELIPALDALPTLEDLLGQMKASPSQEKRAPTPALQNPPATKHDETHQNPIKAEPVKQDDMPKPDVQASIRVDLDKVDKVVDMVGELVITQSMLTQAIDDHLRERYPDVVRGLEILAQHTRSLQDSVMSIRAQPVKSVFARMPRLVRELSSQLGKKARLEMHGEMTEIDKTVIEQLADPLTHMIRNSLDHGIEMPEARQVAGKPVEGVISLHAEQVGGRIVIQVADDGAGISRSRVLAKAIERGIVMAGAAMSDEEIDELIFAPGFSTAEAVTSVSGRGAGMDGGRKNMAKLSGRVSVKNAPGRGATMTLTLPLTLAVMDVMMVRVGDIPFVMPLSSIIETMQSNLVSIGHLPNGAQVLRARGEYVPLMEMTRLFRIEGRPSEDGTFIILCESDGNARVAVVVDAIYGQQQVVIKSIEQNFERLEGIAGATILGDGQVALILDIAGLKRIAERKASNAMSIAGCRLAS